MNRTSSCCGLIVVRPPFFSGAALVAVLAFVEPSDSWSDFPLATRVDGSAFGSSISSLSVPLIRRFAVDDGDADGGSDVFSSFAADSVDGMIDVVGVSSVLDGLVTVAPFFLLPRGAAGFFFSSLLLPLPRALVGRVSAAGVVDGALSTAGGDVDGLE